MKHPQSSLTVPLGSTMTFLLGLDVPVATMVVAVVMAVLLPTTRVATEKAHLTEVLVQSRVGQIEIMERMALTGPVTGPVAQAEPVVDMGGKLNLSTRVSAENYVLNGQFTNSAASFYLAFAPSVILGEPAGSVNLLCGSYGARPGWSGLVQGPGTNLSESLTPAVCSARLSRKKQ